MRLNDEEQAMLAGDAGPALQRALSYQLQVGEFFGADRFVPVSNAHFMGDYEVMDAAGLAYLDWLADNGARVRVPTTRNSTCGDHRTADAYGLRAELVDGEARITAVLRRLGMMAVNTCIGYQTVYTPRLGEHVAWGDTGTVAYANSVLGARTNYEAGPASLYAGMTGRTPGYGLHLDECRRATARCRIDAPLRDPADWGAVGAIIGRRLRGYGSVPALDAPAAEPTPDDLKHLGASLASYGSIAMFHLARVTPEAADLGQPAESSPEIEVDQRQIEEFLGASSGGHVDVVVFSAPQLSLVELQRLAALLDGRRVAAGVQLVATTNAMVAAAAAGEGILAALEQSGASVVTGTCWYIMDPAEMQRRFGWRRVVTNSAKLANIIVAHGFEPVVRRTADCVEAAVNGRVS